MGYLGFVQNKAQSLNFGYNCLKMANVKVKMTDWNNHLSEAVVDIMVIKLSVVKDMKSTTSLSGTPGSTKSKKTGNFGVSKRKIKSMKAMDQKTPGSKDRLETEERDILSDRKGQDEEGMGIELISKEQDSKNSQKKVKNTISTDISRMEKINQEKGADQELKLNRKTSIMQKLEYSSNESSSSSEENEKRQEEPSQKSKEIIEKFEVSKPGYKLNSFTRSILVLPENRKYGTLGSLESHKLSKSNVQSKKCVRFDSRVYQKSGTLSSGTKKKMVIINPSALHKNDLEVPLRIPFVIVSPRLIGSDSDSKSPPDGHKQSFIQADPVNESGDEEMKSPDKKNNNSVLGDYISQQLSAGQQSNTDFKTNKSEITTLKDQNKESEEEKCNNLFSPDPPPRMRSKRRKPTGYIKKQPQSSSPREKSQESEKDDYNLENNFEKLFNTGIFIMTSPQEKSDHEGVKISSSMEMNIGNIAESKESGQEALSSSLKSKDFEKSDPNSSARKLALNPPKRVAKKETNLQLIDEENSDAGLNLDDIEDMLKLDDDLQKKRSIKEFKE